MSRGERRSPKNGSMASTTSGATRVVALLSKYTMRLPFDISPLFLMARQALYNRGVACLRRHHIKSKSLKIKFIFRRKASPSIDSSGANVFISAKPNPRTSVNVNINVKIGAFSF
jgi:hypothetical protein